MGMADVQHMGQMSDVWRVVHVFSKYSGITPVYRYNPLVTWNVKGNGKALMPCSKCLAKLPHRNRRCHACLKPFVLTLWNKTPNSWCGFQLSQLQLYLVVQSCVSRWVMLWKDVSFGCHEQSVVICCADRHLSQVIHGVYFDCLRDPRNTQSTQGGIHLLCSQTIPESYVTSVGLAGHPHPALMHWWEEFTLAKQS